MGNSIFKVALNNEVFVGETVAEFVSNPSNVRMLLKVEIPTKRR